MNSMTVGMENLPNVFIESIEIIPIGTRRIKIFVTLAMFDHKDDHSWYNKPGLEDLQVKIVFLGGSLPEDKSELTAKINALNNGDDSLYNYGASLPDVTVLSANSDFHYEQDAGEHYEKFTTTISQEFDLLAPYTNSMIISNLNVYAACFVEISPPFGIDLFDKFYGPMSAERIYQAGSIVDKSGYLYKPSTNEEYIGPAHMHGGTFMVGSQHSPEPHDTLRYVVEDNLKIIAYNSNPLEVTEPSGPILGGEGGTDFPEDIPDPDVEDGPKPGNNDNRDPDGFEDMGNNIPETISGGYS